MKKYEAKIVDVAHINLEGLGFEGYDDNIKVYTFHRHYRIGNKHSYSSLQECFEDNKKDNHVFSLYMYDHSGAAFSLAPFGERWDSGLLGYICISKNISSIEATKMACDMVQEANDIEDGAYVELKIKELDICDCCNNVKKWEYVGVYPFNLNKKIEKAYVSLAASSYINGFDIKDLDKLIENRYKN